VLRKEVKAKEENNILYNVKLAAFPFRCYKCSLHRKSHHFNQSFFFSSLIWHTQNARQYLQVTLLLINVQIYSDEMKW